MDIVFRELLCRFAACMMAVVAVFFAGCSKLSGSTGFDSQGYQFPGISSVSANGDGTFTLGWEEVPARAPHYRVYMKQGTDSDPEATAQSFDFTKPWKEGNFSALTTDNLSLSHNACFLVRLILSGYTDSNMAELCTNHERYRVTGHSSLANGDGTYTVQWQAAPVPGGTFQVFRKTGTAVSPDASEVTFSFDSPWREVQESTFVSENQLLRHNVCYVIRFKYPGYVDTNTKEICTQNVKYPFLGIVGSEVLPAGKMRLSWESIPLGGVQYRLFSLAAGAEPEAWSLFSSLSETTLEIDAPPFGTRKCYAVRYYVPGYDADSNVVTQCVGETSLGSFSGIDSVTSPTTGTIQVAWQSASGAAQYRIYRGDTFSQLLRTIEADSGTSVTLDGLTPEQEYRIGVRAVDSTGREDANTKTIAVQVANYASPTFGGIASLARSGERGIVIGWLPALPTPASYNLYLAFRDSTHADAALNCALPANAIACRDLFDWSTPYSVAAGSVIQSTVSDLADDQVVFAAVRAVSAAGVEDNNVVVRSVMIPDAGAPIFAGAAEVSVVNGKAQVTWLPAKGQTSWYRVTVAWSDQSAVNDVAAIDGTGNAATTFLSENLIPSTTYSFRVNAVDRYDNIDTNSAVRTLTTGDTIAPAQVQGILAESVAGSESQIRFSFTTPADTDVTSYRFEAEKCLSAVGIYTASPVCSNNAWGPVMTVAAVFDPLGLPAPLTATHAVVGNLTGRSLYRFSVAAVDAAGNSSDPAQVLIATNDLTPPVFGGVIATDQHPLHPTQVRVRWETPAAADLASFIVYRAQIANGACFANLQLRGGVSIPADVGVSSQIVSDPAATAFSFADLTTGGETWCFTVHAVDDRNNEDTNTISRTYTVPDLTPPAFDADSTTATWSAVSDGILLNWSAATGAAQYRIRAQCINEIECTGATADACEFPSQTSAGVWPSIDGDWVDLAIVNHPTTTYVLSRTGSIGDCSGAQGKKYRFLVSARKVSSDWDNNSVVKPAASGVAIPDQSPPTWADGSELTVQHTSDEPGAEAVRLRWPKARDVFTVPTLRSGSGVASYSIDLVRSSAPLRVTIRNSAGNWNSNEEKFVSNITASDMQVACAAAGLGGNTGCEFIAGGSYKFAVRATDYAGNAQQALDPYNLISIPKTLLDATPPVLTEVSLSSTVLSQQDSVSLNFTSSEGGSYRILECTSGCDTTPVYTQRKTGFMVASTQVSVNLTASDFSWGVGTKKLAIELRDASENIAIYNWNSSPAVASLTVFDVSPPILSYTTITPTLVADSSSFAVKIIADEDGTFNIYECIANCQGGGPTVTSIATGSMTAGVQVSHTISASTLSPGVGDKIIWIKLKDASDNESASYYTASTSPAVPVITIYDSTPPALIGNVTFSDTNIELSESTTLTITSSESGTYEVLECTGSCNTVGATYATPALASGNMTASSARNIIVSASSLSAGPGVKNLGVRITDASNNSNTYHFASVPSISPITIVDTVAPSVSVSSPTVTHLNSQGAVTYTLTYADEQSVDAITLSAGDISLAQVSGTSSCLGKSVALVSTLVRSVTLSNCSGDGVMQLDVAAGTARDTSGNLAPAAQSTVGFEIDNTLPSVSVAVAVGSPVDSTGSVSFDLTYTGATSITLASSDITLTPVSGDPFCSTINVSGSGVTSRTVTVSGCTGIGVVELSVAASTATDDAGNAGAAYSTPSRTFTVDNPLILSYVSASAASVKDGSSFTLSFLCSTACNWAVADVTGGGNVALGSSLGVLTAQAVSVVVSAESLSAGAGVKTLQVTLTDPLGDDVVYDDTSFPMVPEVTRILRPQNNVTDLHITRDRRVSPTRFALSWSLPGVMGDNDVVLVRRGTATPPASCTAGTAVVTLPKTSTTHAVDVAGALVGQVSFAVFVRDNDTGLCAIATAASQAVWNVEARVSNQSTHTHAKYKLNSTSGGTNNIKIIESRDGDRASAWDGVNENTSASVCGGGATCVNDLSSADHFVVSTKTISSPGVSLAHDVDFSVGATTPVWAKRWFRFRALAADGKSSDLTPVYAWARVPPGMVFIGKENWPQNQLVGGASLSTTENHATSGLWDQATHDFAIDVYESSVAGVGTFGSPTAFPNSATEILISEAVEPEAGQNWYAFKQGCLNRSYYGADFPTYTANADISEPNTHGAYSIPNPRRKFHLATGTEWMIASRGTPDDPNTEVLCNVEGSSAINPSLENTTCLSETAVRNAIGNLAEWTDDWGNSGHRGSVLRWSGTSAVRSTLSAWLLRATDGTSGSWDFPSAIRIALGSSVSFSSDSFSPLYEDGGTLAGGDGDGLGWVAVRGGDWDDGETAGRFALSWRNSPLNSSEKIGGRCAIVAPQAQPTIARFASESDGTAAKLFWLVHDTENTSSVQLGWAATKAEIDAWDGIGAAAGVSVESQTPGTAFTNECGWTPSSGNTYTGHMCDNTLSGDNFYKLCVTNPAVSQVTDGFSAAERTACSPVLAVQALATPPSLVVLTSGALLQNDSDGAFARFYWKESAGSNVIRKLIFGVDKAEVERWNGDNAVANGFAAGNGWAQSTYVGSLGGIKVLTGGPVSNTEITSECAQAHLSTDGLSWTAYNPDAEAKEGHATGFTHYACVNLSRFPQWTKFWFKVAIASSDSAASNTGTPVGGWQMSETRGVGYVPTGMVLIAAEEWATIQTAGFGAGPYLVENYTNWPRCVGASGGFPAINAPAHVMPGVSGWPFSNGVGCLYDFAIDKYEAYSAGGTTDGSMFTSEDSMTGNTATMQLRSQRARTPVRGWGEVHFPTYVRGCANRTALLQSQFIDSAASPLNQVRLPSGTEWVVASFGTEDRNDSSVCLVNVTDLANTGIHVNCVSRFGTFDQIGNVQEVIDVVRVSTLAAPNPDPESIVWKRFYGTPAVTSFPSYGTNGAVPTALLNLGISQWMGTWDALSGMPALSGAASSGSYYSEECSKNEFMCAYVLGGRNISNLLSGVSRAGRFSVEQHVIESVGQWGGRAGARCIVSPP